MILESFLQNSTGSNINEVLESLLQEQKKLLQSTSAMRVMAVLEISARVFR